MRSKNDNLTIWQFPFAWGQNSVEGILGHGFLELGIAGFRIQWWIKNDAWSSKFGKQIRQHWKTYREITENNRIKNGNQGKKKLKNKPLFSNHY